MTVEVLLAFIIGLGAGMAWERWGTRQGDEQVQPQPAETDAVSLRVEWKDHLDRMEHLYDRIRKRARVPAGADTSPESGAVVGSKDELRDLARRKGLM